MVTGAPGNTTPVEGVTVIQADPETTVKGMGPPVVVSRNVCGAGRAGGALKASVGALTDKVGSAFTITRVTDILRGLAIPVAVKLMVAW